jgi:hypothetical protein
MLAYLFCPLAKPVSPGIEIIRWQKYKYYALVVGVDINKNFNIRDYPQISTYYGTNFHQFN